MTALFLAGAAVLLGLLTLLGLAIRSLAARAPRPDRPMARMALANLHRPGAQTDRLVVALGLGFSLFVALAVIDTSLSSELTNAAPAKAPRFFAIDLQPEDAGTFRKAVPLTPAQFHYAFTNELDEAASRRVYDELHVPAAGHVLWEGALGAVRRGATAVDYRKPDRAPLLLVGGGADHIVPAALTRAVHRKYAKGTATVDYREYADRTHHTVGQAGWEQLADESLGWAREHLPARA